jgi:uncharacterized protein
MSGSPALFFALVLALSVPLWWVDALGETQLLPGLPLSAVMVVCPLLAALILVARERGRAGAIEHLKRFFAFGRIEKRRWYAPILFLMPLAALTAYAAMRALGRPLPAAEVSLAASLALVLLFFVAGLAEELGWSGYAFDRLQERHSALAASVILGLCWAAWHVVPLLTNLSWQLFPNQGSHYDPRIFGTILAIAAVLVTLVWGPRALRRPATTE